MDCNRGDSLQACSESSRTISAATLLMVFRYPRV